MLCIYAFGYDVIKCFDGGASIEGIFPRGVVQLICFISLDRTFIWLLNDIYLKLQLPYFILPKNGSCMIQPLRGVV